MIEKDKVKHIADLAKINISEEEYPKYQQQLYDILSEIEKIQEVEITEEEIMISPIENRNCYKDDIILNHISKEDALRNAKRVSDDYIIVPKVIEWDI